MGVKGYVYYHCRVILHCLVCKVFWCTFVSNREAYIQLEQNSCLVDQLAATAVFSVEHSPGSRPPEDYHTFRICDGSVVGRGQSTPARPHIGKVKVTLTGRYSRRRHKLSLSTSPNFLSERGTNRARCSLVLSETTGWFCGGTGKGGGNTVARKSRRTCLLLFLKVRELEGKTENETRPSPSRPVPARLGCTYSSVRLNRQSERQETGELFSD